MIKTFTLFALIVLTFIETTKAEMVGPASCPPGQIRWSFPGNCEERSKLIKSRSQLCKQKDWKACWEICLIENNSNPDLALRKASECSSIPYNSCLDDKNLAACERAQFELTQQTRYRLSMYSEADFEKLDKLRKVRRTACSAGAEMSCKTDELTKARENCEARKLASVCLEYYTVEATAGDPKIAESFYQAAFRGLEENCRQEGKDCNWLDPLIAGDPDWARACARASTSHPRKKTFCEISESLQKRGASTTSKNLPIWSDAMGLILPKDFRAQPGWPQLKVGDFPVDPQQPCEFDRKRLCVDSLQRKGIECFAAVRDQLSAACFKVAERALIEWDERHANFWTPRSKKMWIYSPSTDVCGHKRPPFEPRQKIEVFAGYEDNCHVELDPLSDEAAQHLVQNLSFEPPVLGKWTHVLSENLVRFTPDASAKGWSRDVTYKLVLKKPLPKIVDEYESVIIWAK